MHDENGDGDLPNRERHRDRNRARISPQGHLERRTALADRLRTGVGSERRALNAILASDDPCAVDAVGAQLLGGRPADVTALRLAAQHEVGKDKWIDIAINGVPIPRRGSRSHPAAE